MSSNHQLEERIAKLESIVEDLSDAYHYLSFSKKKDHKYSFWDWIVQNKVFGEMKIRLDWVFHVLSSRIEGKKPFKKKELKGVSSEKLYQGSKPTVEELKILVMQALEAKNAKIVDELFEALRNQGIQKSLTDLYFSSQK